MCMCQKAGVRWFATLFYVKRLFHGDGNENAAQRFATFASKSRCATVCDFSIAGISHAGLTYAHPWLSSQ